MILLIRLDARAILYRHLNFIGSHLCFNFMIHFDKFLITVDIRVDSPPWTHPAEGNIAFGWRNIK